MIMKFEDFQTENGFVKIPADDVFSIKKELERIDKATGNLDQYLTEHNEMRADLKLIKDTVFDLLKKIGFVQPDGSFREGLDMKAVMAFAMSIATGGKKVQEQFAGISALIPLVEKYKDL